MDSKRLFLIILTAISIQSCNTKSGNEINQFDPDILTRIEYNNSGEIVDLGVGLWAWPMPMDFDNDGDLDLVVSCPDKPYNGTYFFENPDGNVAMPVFLPAVKIGVGKKNILVSMVNGQDRILIGNNEIINFKDSIFSISEKIYSKEKIPKSTGNQRFTLCRYNDFNGDGITDLIISIDDWGDYGWDNAFSEKGEWLRGPLHGSVHIALNKGSENDPEYSDPFELHAGDQAIDVYGAPFADFADYDGDGDQDLICAEFLDGFNYFENIGTRTDPVYAPVKRLINDGKEIKMDLQMITPTSIDWDKDGDIDLVVGDEDGRVALIQNTGQVVNGMPQFLQPQYFQQESKFLKFGVLATPVSVDWDDDGDEDLIAGNSAGYIGFIENLDGGNPPKWAPPIKLEIEGKPIRIQAGPNGSIQGPAEAKWGYTTVSVIDWDNDGLLDILANSIWGRIVWYKNKGEKGNPILSEEQAVEVEWVDKNPKPAWNWWNPKGKEMVSQWRTTPYSIDWNKDGLNDLVMLDHEGYLAFFERQKKDGKLILLPGKRIFVGTDRDAKNNIISDISGLLRLNSNSAGKSGRRKLCFADWDGDGLQDLLINSGNVNFLKNMGDSAGFTKFKFIEVVDTISILAGHTTSPTIVDWNKDKIPDLLVGAEDGHFYYLPNNSRK
jgi:FG-GAP-like repeat